MDSNTQYSPEQLAQSRALGELHYQWQGKHLESATFDPVSRPESADYAEWNTELDAGADAEAEFMQAADKL